MGGQEHFYLEGQAAIATPGEAGQLHILSSTQHPSEIQHLVARLLNLDHGDVVVEVRRMGGAFGGKGDRRPPPSPPPARWSQPGPDGRPSSAPTATTTWR